MAEDPTGARDPESAGDSVSESPSPKRRHRSLWIVALVTAVLLIACALAWWHHDSEAGKNAAAHRVGPPPVPVTNATARKGDINVYLNAIGTVTPVYTTSVTSQVNGAVVTVHYREGQPVHRGDALIDIDSRPYRATLLQAQGLLERDENVLAQARMDLARYKAALAKNAVAEQIVADQEKVVLQDQGTVKNDLGAVQYDQVQVDYCHITSPIEGRVGLRLVDPGNVVQATTGLTMAVITQVQPITVVFTIAEDNLSALLARMRANAKLKLDVMDRSGEKSLASGELVALDNQIDTTTGTVKGRALFENKDDALFPNQFVNTRLLLDTLRGVTLLPASAIQRNGKASFVYLIKENTAYVQSVTPGVTEAGMTQVDGVNPGDVVANSSFERLQDKTKVSIANTPESAGEKGSGAP